MRLSSRFLCGLWHLWRSDASDSVQNPLKDRSPFNFRHSKRGTREEDQKEDLGEQQPWQRGRQTTAKTKSRQHRHQQQHRQLRSRGLPNMDLDARPRPRNLRTCKQETGAVDASKKFALKTPKARCGCCRRPWPEYRSSRARGSHGGRQQREPFQRSPPPSPSPSVSLRVTSPCTEGRSGRRRSTAAARARTQLGTPKWMADLGPSRISPPSRH